MDLKKLAENRELYDDVAKFDLIGKLRPLFVQGGFYFDRDTKKIKPRVSGFIWETPWITVHHAPGRECYLWHSVLFDHLKIIPSGCLNCWKVVARPNTLDEMFRLHDMMQEWKRPSKIGIEVRAHVRSLYGAYFYNNGYEEGKECLDFVKGEIHAKISPEIDVHLKRYCTEFELHHGPSDEGYEQSEDDKTWEKLVMDTFDTLAIPETSFDQPEAVVKRTIRLILEYADKMKDKTAWKYNGGEPIIKNMVRYGEEE